MNFIPATVSIPGYQVGTWKADPGHSEIAFSVHQLLVSEVRGRFTSHDATIVTAKDQSTHRLPRRLTLPPSTPATSRATTTFAPPHTSTSTPTPG